MCFEVKKILGDESHSEITMNALAKLVTENTSLNCVSWPQAKSFADSVVDSDPIGVECQFVACI